MTSFEAETQVPFEIKLENVHFIHDEQMLSGIMLRGPSKNTFNFSYNRRSDLHQIKDLGTAITNIATLVPNGLLVFFSSYRLLDKCYKL